MSAFSFSKMWRYILKDWSIDWRNKFSLGGVFLYIITSTFIVFLSFGSIDPPAWNSLFWIILLFGVLNGIVKSFTLEGGERKLYYYQLVDPIVILASKIIYNFLLTFLMAIITYFLLTVFITPMVENLPAFFLIILAGSLSLSITFTFISSLAAQGQQSTTLMAILGLPVIIPVMLTLVKLTKNTLGIVLEPEYGTDFMILAAISLILLGISLWLFPIIWKE